MSGRPRILIVDDEPSIVKMVSKRLEVEGFEVAVAMDGEEGLQKVESESPDLIVLDLMLPKINGYEVCAQLKQNERYQKIPILLFTAKTQAKDERLGRECGADAYMRKPFQGKELVDNIRILLGGGWVRPAGGGS